METQEKKENGVNEHSAKCKLISISCYVIRLFLESIFELIDQTLEKHDNKI